MFLLAGIVDVIRNLHICCEEHEEEDFEEETFEEEDCDEPYDVEDPSSPGSSLEDTNDQVMLNEAHKVDSAHLSDGLGLDEEASSPNTGLKRQISRTPTQNTGLKRQISRTPTARPGLGGKQDTLNSMTKAFSDHRKTLRRKSLKDIARAEERRPTRRPSGIPRRENSYPRSSAERTPKTSDQQTRASSDSRLAGGLLSLGISPFQVIGRHRSSSTVIRQRTHEFITNTAIFTPTLCPSPSPPSILTRAIGFFSNSTNQANSPGSDGGHRDDAV
mmetsp:Transcript_26972/g.72453  ORF Transcript_26972/g.72453 Transcript_26972/m.72453 type:complete len:274 (-) Transcript_26972:314-1135(-)